MARYLMFQGTGSGVGKSLMVAGFCRYFVRKGVKVVPFKAQNMSLNSGVTPWGEEIGRAQMLQARAAYVEPDARMNPILLKPQGDKTSQVIVGGKVWETHDAYDYYEKKDFLWEKVTQSLQSLDQEYDLVCMEGAGSPAEINLRDKDVVNMAVARYTNAPVILIGDIERGGVFAQLYGTWALLLEEERMLLRGFLINKFRGDPAILEPGLREIEHLTGVPILGVIPYFRFHLDDEDSQTDRMEAQGKRTPSGDVHIGIIHLYHISNFTDFEPLEVEEDVEVRYVYPDEGLDDFDVLIIPGSKNTIGDLKQLLDHHFREKLDLFIQKGGVILGICGGFQMLGERICDPEGVESSEKEVTGLSLISMDTVFGKEKTLRVVSGWCKYAPEIKVKGYEIHMGESRILRAISPLFQLERGNGRVENEGAVVGETIFGTYVHGLFDDAGFRRYFINLIRKRKGLSPLHSLTLSWQETVDQELDRLADIIEEYVDVKKIEEEVMKGEREC